MSAELAWSLLSVSRTRRASWAGGAAGHGLPVSSGEAELRSMGV